MSKHGRIEAQLTANAVLNATITTTGGGGGGPTTVVALAASASAFMTDLCAAFEAALNAAAIGTWTVVPSFGENGTGQVTIHCSTAATWTLTWDSPSFRNLLGFTGNIAGVAVAQTGARHAQSVWLPACPVHTRFGPNDPGAARSNTQYLVGPRGHVSTLTGQRRRRNTLRWSHVPRARARITGETIVGESYEQWWEDCHLGEIEDCITGAKIRYVWDADVDGTYTEYKIVDHAGVDPEPSVPNLATYWPVELQVFEVPS